MRLTALQSLIASWLAVGYLADRVDVAASLAREALDHSRQRQERGDHAWSLWLSGEVASRRDADVVAVEGLYRQALDQASHLGMPPLGALCRLALGHLYRSARSAEEGDAELRAAAKLFSEMDMTPWALRAPQEATR